MTDESKENKKPVKKYSPEAYAMYARARDIRFVSRDDDHEDQQEESISAWEI